MRKPFFILLIIAVCAVAYTQLIPAKKIFPPTGRPGPMPPESGEEIPQGISQKVLSFNLKGYHDNGRKKWELQGACADIMANVIKLDYVTAKAYGDDSLLTLTARSGVFDKMTKDIHLEHNVVGRSSDGARLLTDRLDWNQKTESVTTDALVRIEKDDLVSVGKGATGSPGLKMVELRKDVMVEIRDNPPTVITCDGPLTVDYQRNIAILNNSVKVADQRGEIYADRMKVLFNPTTRKITRIVAIGGVKIQKEGSVTYSDRAIYSVRDGRVRLVGKPKIVVIPK